MIALTTQIGNINALEKFKLPPERIVLLPQRIRDEAIKRLPFEVIKKAISQMKAVETESMNCTCKTMRECAKYTTLNGLNMTKEILICFITFRIIRKAISGNVCAYADEQFARILKSQDSLSIEELKAEEDFLK